jgi:hypothetical protein
MGLLNLFSKRADSTPGPVALPSGSFTINASGRLVCSTLPRGFPEPLIGEIARVVLVTFSSALEAQLRLTEFTVHYAALKITAREMGGGAIVFLAPRGLARK